MSRTPATIINTNIEQQNVLATQENSQLIISRRGTVNGTEPLSVLNDLYLYEVFQIPPQQVSNPIGLLNYFKNTIGATVTQGIESTITLIAPDAVTVSVINSQSFTLLTWNSEPAGWENISGITLNGVASQTSASGTIFSVSSTGYTLTLSNVTGIFTTLETVLLNYTNTSVTAPDGQATEQFVLDSYYAAAALNGNESTFNVSVTTPNIYLLIVSDVDGVFNPNATPFSLGLVDRVIDNGDGTLTFEWDTQPTNWLYVPQNMVGNSIVANPPNTATFLQQLAPQYTTTGEAYAMKVEPIGGSTFADNDPITMTLDDTFSILTVAEQNYYKIINVNYDLTDSTDITNAAGTLYPFTQYLSTINSNIAPQSGQYGSIGIVGMTNVTVPELMTFGDINNANYSIPFYYYQQMLGDIYISAGQLAASYAAIIASNEVPYPNLDGFVLNGFPVSSDTNSFISVGTNQDSDTILNKGLTPIGVNTESEPYIVRPVSTQLTIPGSGEPDNEFYDMHVQQVIRELKLRTWDVSQLPQFQNALITNILLNRIETAVYGMLKQAEIENMIFDVDALKDTIVAVQDSENPNQVDISYEVKITAALEIQVYNINIISSINTTTLAA